MARIGKTKPRGGVSGAAKLFLTALGHYQAGRLVQSEASCREALALDFDHGDAWHLSGIIAGQTGRLDEAIARLEQALRVRPNWPEVLNSLGLALKEQGRSDEAIARYRQALDLVPEGREILFNIGTACLDQRHPREAIAYFERAVQIKPVSPEVLYNFGNALKEIGDYEAAVARFTQAVDLKPDYYQALHNLGNALKEGGRVGEAIVRYRDAVRVKPDFVAALNSLGHALLEEGQPHEAIEPFQQVLRIAPTDLDALVSIGVLFANQGQIGPATDSFRRALACHPNSAEARLALAIFGTLPHVLDGVADEVSVSAGFSRALNELDGWAGDHIAALGRVIGRCQPFYLAYRPGNICGHLFRYGDIASRAASAYWGANRLPAVRPRRDRIRLVVICGFIRSHPVWTVVLRGLVAHLDRRRFELILYHTTAKTDRETVWARAQADAFVQGPQGLEGWLKRLADDQPDVLFYPEIGMDPITGGLAALRLAPVQVVGWGHPVTTGLPTVDAFLSGALLEGWGADTHYRERLVRLPGVGACTVAPDALTAPVPLAQADSVRLALPADRRIVRFALCQTPYKFSPRDDELYVRIAKAAGPCRFWLPAAAPETSPAESAQVRDRLAAAFRRAGLNPDEMIVTFPWLSPAQFQTFLDEMDVYLDCPGFSGYTTAWQAAHRGLPIVTLEGRFLRQRLAAGLLRQIGQTESLATTRRAYVVQACRLAHEVRDPQRRDALRAAWRAAAPRADGSVEVVRAFEHALVEMVDSQRSQGTSRARHQALAGLCKRITLNWRRWQSGRIRSG